MMRYQFQVDGREAGPVREQWHEAAQDAVAAGYGVWTGFGEVKLDDSQGAEIARVE